MALTEIAAGLNFSSYPPSGLAFGEPDDRLQRVSSNRGRLRWNASAAAYWIVRSSRTMTAEFVGRHSVTTMATSHQHLAAGANGRPASFRTQVVAPLLFALNATNGAIGDPFLGRAIIDHLDRKGAARACEHAKFFDGLASGPKPELLEAVSRQICPANSHGVFQEAHGAVPPGGIVAPASLACLPENSD